MSLTVAVVGATGAVGAEMLACLETSAPADIKVTAHASPRSAGKTLQFRGAPVTVQALDDNAFKGAQYALFASSKEISRDYAPVAQESGAVVIDNSSWFRMHADVPLVVPEINGALLKNKPTLVANPNCTAAIMGMAMWPLHQISPVKRLVCSTYQAASGAGAAAMEELVESTRAYLDGKSFTPKVLPHPYAFNVFSHNAGIDQENGYNGEELKVIEELQKILGLPDLRVGVTCVRVPVLRAHAMAMSIETAAPIEVDAARRALDAAPGVKVVDDRARNYFPMPVEASGGDDVLVGRLRRDISDPTGCTINAFISGDQLRKGAALNAVQIAEALGGWKN
jgi:aspartate-semialdehyde dehydrogenase